ncbi:MAG: hypothetical protein ACUVQ6_02990 [Dissulfurimicrobium sp.]|uniref:hypothetical protein n=1 Tax=Dissulfurimicrobium sp. TaxID=2022436 RepID=UPI00404B514D
MLTASAKELDGLADTVKSDKEMKATFSRAEYAVANNDYVKGDRFMDPKKGKRDQRGHQNSRGSYRAGSGLVRP